MSSTATKKSLIPTLTPLAALILLAGCADTALHQTHTFDAPIHVVDIEVDAGAVEVAGHAAADTEVTVSFECDSTVPDYDLDLTDGVLTLRMHAGPAAASCDGHFRLTVPAEVASKIRAWNGDVTLAGLRGGVTASTLDGHLVAEDVRGERLELTAVSGDVRGRDLEVDRLAARTGAGEVTLALTDRPVQITVEVLAGDAHLDVPGEKFRIAAEARSGSVVLDHVHHSTTAPWKIDAATQAGDIVISGS